MKHKSWSENDINFLIENYLVKGGKFVADQLNRSVDSVKTKAKRINLIGSIPKKWTFDEIEFLKNNYNEHGNKFICEKLNRSRGTVGKKAKELGLKADYKPTFTKEELEIAVKKSYCFSDLVSVLGKTKTGTYFRIIRKYLVYYGIDTKHFDQYKKNRINCENGLSFSFPIEHWLQNGSNISSSKLKPKLYKLGIKKRECELCGQTEEWMGKKMSLILDHKNGVNNDNRLENLRIVCPNCNATLDTHCRGYKKK